MCISCNIFKITSSVFVIDVKPARIGANDKMGGNQDDMRDRSPMRGGPPDLMDIRTGVGRDGRGRDWRDRDR